MKYFLHKERNLKSVFMDGVPDAKLFDTLLADRHVTNKSKCGIVNNLFMGMVLVSNRVAA